MINFISLFLDITGTHSFLLSIASISFCIKFILFLFLIYIGLRTKKMHRSCLFFILVLAGGMVSDFSWIISSARHSFFQLLEPKIGLFIVRIAWVFTLIQYLALSLFIESLTEKKYSIRSHQKLYLIFTSILCSFFLYYAFLKFNVFEYRSPFEFKIMSISSVLLFFMVIPSIILAWQRINEENIPKILNKQFKLLIKFIIGPQIVSDLIQVFPFSFPFSNTFTTNNLSFVSISSLLLTIALYYTARKIMGLRFLNLNEHVQTTQHFNFMDDFKTILEQLSQASSKQELGYITSNFFKLAFRIPTNHVMLYIRKLNQKTTLQDEPLYTCQTAVEQLLLHHEADQASDIKALLEQSKILITDELAFSNFYEDTLVGKTLLNFMQSIDADIFIPIYQKKTIIAYIVIARDARIGDFYNRIERDEMVVFASYLSNIIHLMQHRNLDSLIARDKEIQEELYRKHREINQYKESFQTFFKNSRQRKIGTIFYKNRQFIFGNQIAKELITINPNMHEGHPLSKALKKVASQAQEYKNNQSLIAYDHQGNKIVLNAIPHLAENSVIINVYYPEMSDLLKDQIDHLDDPSEWDYILYLETTQSGKLINQLIPSNSHHLLRFKIELLKLALSKKALLLDMNESDAQATTHIIHHISLNETLHILKLNAKEQNHETAQKLFGLNPLFGTSGKPLLEKLNNNGTLLIQNIHFLDVETQKYLLEFIKYGYYKPFKSEQKSVSLVRIICSTDLDLLMLVQNGTFNAELYQELKKSALALPSLLTLSEHELADLAHGFSEQVIKDQSFKNALELTHQETNRIIMHRPVSLQEFKNKIEQFLIDKSKKQHIYHETQFDPGYNIADPELAQAARLGKKALKDPKVMAFLWQKFSNQNQIATLLEVNRSSVNRRCKEYNLC